MCGVHIVEDGEEIDIDFQKYCPINNGKLCKFGIDLPRIYKNCLESPMIDGNLAGREEAIAEAARRLNDWYHDSDGREGLVLCCGDATNEEHLAMKEFASHLGMKRASGLGHVLKAVGNTPFIHDIKNFDIVEGFEQIVLVNIDPYYQYPLVARKLQNAKRRGKKIVSIGPEGTHVEGLADDIMLCRPTDVHDRLKGYVSERSENYTLYIASMGPYSDPTLIAELNNACHGTNSRVFFIKDYANTEASIIMGFNNYESGIEDIIEHIEEGRINALVLVESPLYDTYLDNERFRKACERLKVLVVVQSLMPRDLPANAVLVPMPAFYKRRGTLVNACGRILDLGGYTEGLIGVLNDLNEKMRNGQRMEFGKLSSRAREIYGRWIMEFKDYKKVPVPEHVPADNDTIHYYVVNPFLIRGMDHQLVKRANGELYDRAKERESYVLKKNVAEGVILAYQRDPRYKKMICRY